MKTFTFKLEDPVEYSSGGNMVEGNEIVFSAPKPNQRRKTTKLKQAFFRALPKEGEEDPDKKKDEDTVIRGAEVLYIIAQSDIADYPDFIETGRTLICDDVGKIDDIGVFNVTVADRLPIEVLEEIIGEYVANFIVRSAIRSIMKNS